MPYVTSSRHLYDGFCQRRRLGPDVRRRGRLVAEDTGHDGEQRRFTVFEQNADIDCVGRNATCYTRLRRSFVGTVTARR